jgi:hypothetical protein
VGASGLALGALGHSKPRLRALLLGSFNRSEFWGILSLSSRSTCPGGLALGAPAHWPRAQSADTADNTAQEFDPPSPPTTSYGLPIGIEAVRAGPLRGFGPSWLLALRLIRNDASKQLPLLALEALQLN